MEASRYLQCLAADYGDLRDAASAAELTANVPSCPGWTVADLVRHVAQVYLHKVVLMRTGEEPREWPPPSLAAEAPLAALGRAYGALRAEFRTRGPGQAAPTWYGPDQTVGFWVRRMAQETVIHRIDAELAAGLPVTPVPDDLAADGVDEVLKRMLAYGSVAWPEDFAEMEGEHLAGPGEITVAAGQAAWTVRPSPRGVVVEDGASDHPKVVIDGPAGNVLRWLWGRARDDAIRTSGDADWADYLRRMLAVVTQ
jgi:uncharacterized protein (TIGR03083 family)